jgi:hypothetical protein
MIHDMAYNMRTQGAALPPAPPKGRGRLLYTADVKREILTKPSVEWIRRNVAPDKAKKIGRDKAWYEADIYDWLEQQ